MPDDRRPTSQDVHGRRGLWPCGVVGAPHGLDGRSHLRLLPDGGRCLRAGTRFFVSRDGRELPRPVRLEVVGGSSRRPLVRVADAATRQAAAAWTGCLLLAAGGELDTAPQYVVGDLIGLPALSSGVELGTVTDVLQGVAQDILVIGTRAGTDVLVPLVDELVVMDAERGVLIIREGLLE